MKDYRATMVAGIAVALVLLLAFALAGLGQGAAESSVLVVRVHDGEGVVHEYPLGENGKHRISTSYGHNTVLIENGTVRMADADCPNRSCLNQAALSQPGAQIVCLPHKLWIEVASSESSQSTELDEGLVVWNDQDGATSDLDTIAR